MEDGGFNVPPTVGLDWSFPGTGVRRQERWRARQDSNL